MYEKKTFKTIFIITTVLLITLPAVTTFNEILTSIVMKIQFYRVIQEFIVPIQAKMIVVVIGLFGIKAIPTPLGVNIGTIQTINHVTISWNCIGWQSFLLFVLTLITGLQGPYTRYSKAQTILIGFLGTFLMNITRISLVVLMTQFISKTAGIIFHDYFSTAMTVAWLFFFWWFSFTYVLERKDQVYEDILTPPRLRLG